MRRAALAWALAGAAAGTAAAPAAPAPPDAAAAIVEHANALRRAHGRGALEPAEPLMRAAQAFAEFMARTNRYGHESDGREPADRAHAAGYAWCFVGENIGWQFRSGGFAPRALGRAFAEGWERSPPHRENLLEPRATEIGVGLAQSAGGRWYGVQLLGRPESAALRFSVANRGDRGGAYVLDGERHRLPPRAVRTHRTCGEGLLALPGQVAIRAEDGGRYALP
jgi:uncharacterized protein YkwD